jgi:flavin-dependent dehydrogenase
LDRCDVLIVGGGPAGSTCARGLARAGLDVVVLDRSAFPRDKVCAGWITPPVVDELELDLAAYRAGGRTLQTFHGFVTSLEDGPAAVVDYGRPVSFGIRRCELDHFLLARSGARLRLGEPATTIERANGRWVVNGEIEAALLVGAGGTFCPVARLLGADGGLGGPVVAQEVEVPLGSESTTVPELPELLFCRELDGYGWCVRKGDFVNVGLGRFGARDLPARVAGLEAMLVARGALSRPLAARPRGHAYRVWEGAPRVVDDSVLLVGDAAGTADPRSGEGIRTAVESGILAAREAVAAAGDYRRARLERYAAALIERFGRPSQSRAGPSDVVPAPLARAIARRLFAWRRFAREVVIDRWFLHAERPPLA